MGRPCSFVHSGMGQKKGRNVCEKERAHAKIWTLVLICAPLRNLYLNLDSIYLSFPSFLYLRT